MAGLKKMRSTKIGLDLTVESMAKCIIDRHRTAQNLAYKSFAPEYLLAQARAIDQVHASREKPGALFGAPISVKDIYGVDGLPTFAGTKRELPAEWARDGLIVKKLKHAGALLTGKTQTVEFAFGGLGQNPNWGTPVNPWSGKEARACGGSSCGAGLTLWDGTAVAALGTDTAGSVRVPASMTGAVGFRPTKGAWATDRDFFPLSQSLDGPGVLTLSAVDAALFHFTVGQTQDDPLNLVNGLSRKNLSSIKIAIDTELVRYSQSDIGQNFEESIAELSRAGAHIEDVRFSEFSAAHNWYFESNVAGIEGIAQLRTHLPDWLDIVHPFIGDRLKAAENFSASAYLQALAQRCELACRANERFSEFDIFATPTLPISPPVISQIELSEKYYEQNHAVTQYTNPVNVLDLSAITMPTGLDRFGLPIGFQLIGQKGQDTKLLSVAISAMEVFGEPLSRIGRPPTPTPIGSTGFDPQPCG